MDALVQRATEVGLKLDLPQLERIWVYFQLLGKWNERINLTGLRVAADNTEAIDRLLVEPLLAATHAEPGAEMVDVGSGGGSPAIPFALALDPAPALTMVESRERKSVFLREALRATGLRGEVHTGRFEDFAAATSNQSRFDLLTVRAVKLDAALSDAVSAVLASGGHVFHLHQRERRMESWSGFEWAAPVELVTTLDSWLSVGDVSRETNTP